MYFVSPDDDKIYQLDGDAVNPLLYQWTSKRFVFEQAITWSCLRLDVDVLQLDANVQYQDLVAQITAENATIVDDYGAVDDAAFNVFAYNTSLLQEVPPAGASVTATITLLGEKDEVKCALTVDSYSPLRIPPFKAREIKIRLNGTLNVRSVALATSMQELRD